MDYSHSSVTVGYLIVAGVVLLVVGAGYVFLRDGWSNFSQV